MWCKAEFSADVSHDHLDITQICWIFIIVSVENSIFLQTEIFFVWGILW